ncbi:hypothetical protein MHU86_3772 [Fragilaria crotonensis]|nr:hypothetical protein MHU86_3772 [Fragilaria crotonensis]
MEKLFLVPFPSAHKSNLIKLSPQLKNIQLKMTPTPDLKLPIVADESIMSPKAHGTSHTPVQSDLRWNCKNELADRICNFNRHYAEHSSYFTETTFLNDAVEDLERDQYVSFYDSNSGKLLFTAPRGRTWDQFVQESKAHGWPSFRDEEVNWEYVRCMKNGESISVDGTHLGHNLPDRKGNRYCINLVSVAGRPTETEI